MQKVYVDSVLFDANKHCINTLFFEFGQTFSLEGV